MEILLSSTVKGTATYKEAEPLYKEIKKAVKGDYTLIIDFINTPTPLSTSFLNGSFGRIIQEHGITLTVRIAVTNIKKSELKRLKEYITDVLLAVGITSKFGGD